MNLTLLAVGVMAVAMWLIPAVPVNLPGAIVIVVFGFFFAAVSSRMVGIVGSSNNPVSGMAIATLLITTMILKATGSTGTAGMAASIAIGSVICIIAAIAGDTSQEGHGQGRGPVRPGGGQRNPEESGGFHRRLPLSAH